MRVLLLAWSLIPATLLAATQADALFPQVSPSVVTVLGLGPGGKVEGQGSGVVIGPDRVVTNCHVVRDATLLQVRQGEQLLAARWQLADPARDLCRLEVAGLAAVPAQVRASTTLAVGERIFAVGNPLGFGLAISEGLISHRIRKAEGTRLYSTAATSPGSSGGGLFDEAGKLVGITTAVMILGQNLNIAVPAEWIADLDRRGSPPPAPTPPPDPEPAWIGKAEQLVAANRWAELEQWSRQWRDVLAESPEPHRFLGLALLNQGHPQAALAPLRAALERHSCHLQVLVHLAAALHAGGDRAAATRMLDQASACDPSAGMPHAELARQRLIDGDLADAELQITRALQLSPGDSWNWALLGRIKERRQEPAAAARAYQIALRQRPDQAETQTSLARALAAAGQGDRARQVLSQVSTAAPDSAVTWLQLGLRELEQKRYADAEHALRKSLEIDPRSVAALVGLAMLQAHTGREAEATARLREALTLRPDDPEALLLLAQQRVRARDLGEARELLLRLLRQKNARPQARRLLAGIYEEQRAYPAALELYQQLVAGEKPEPGDWVGLGKTLVQQGRLAEAEAPLREAERLRPEDIDTLNTLATYYGRQGNSGQALVYLDRLLAKDSSVALAWSSKGYALLQLGRFDESVVALETAVRLQPDLANGWINLGQSLLAKRQLGRAIAALEKAIQLAPGAADARLFLAQAYALSTQYDKSRGQLQALRQISPDALPAYALSITLDLVQGKPADARLSFLQMRARNAAAASQFRAQAIARALPGAAALPE